MLLGHGRKILKLRGVAQPFIKYNVGTGRSIFAWLDNWHKFGPLVNRFGTRIAYDTASNVQSKLDKFIRNGRWNFAAPVSRDLQLVFGDLPAIDGTNDDTVRWTVHT